MSEEVQSGGIGFCGLLTILFIALKLTHYIDWQWKWVLAPLWLPIVVILGIIVLVLGACGIVAFVMKLVDWR